MAMHLSLYRLDHILPWKSQHTHRRQRFRNACRRNDLGTLCRVCPTIFDLWAWKKKPFHFFFHLWKGKRDEETGEVKAGDGGTTTIGRWGANKAEGITAHWPQWTRDSPYYAGSLPSHGGSDRGIKSVSRQNASPLPQSSTTKSFCGRIHRNAGFHSSSIVYR